nr:hypothetical protein CFP56_24413 [Quercus suber]
MSEFPATHVHYFTITVTFRETMVHRRVERPSSFSRPTNRPPCLCRSVDDKREGVRSTQKRVGHKVVGCWNYVVLCRNSASIQHLHKSPHHPYFSPHHHRPICTFCCAICVRENYDVTPIHWLRRQAIHRTRVHPERAERGRAASTRSIWGAPAIVKTYQLLRRTNHAYSRDDRAVYARGDGA